jgi:hypothetical protein
MLTLLLVYGDSRFFYSLILRFRQGALQLALERDMQADKQANKVTDNFLGT